jgi:putative transposase
MGIAAFKQNALLRMDGSEYLLRKISADCWQLENTLTKQIVECTLTRLLQQFADGDLTFLANNGDPSRGKALNDIDSYSWELAKLRRLYVLAVLEVTTRATVVQAITDVWKKTGRPAKLPSLATVYRWKAHYVSSGNDVRALVDHPQGKGNRTRRFPLEVIELCKESISTVFMTRERNTVQDTIHDALARVVRENQLRPAGTALPLPTGRLIRSLIEDISAFDKHSARYGHQEALKHFRFVRGQCVTQHPLERAEIDHTDLDLFVVDDERSLPLGRPWLTACIDAYTRCILGMHLAFTPPSYLTVARCLRDAFLPKTWLKDQYPEIKSDWPAYGVMRELVLDNGAEFHSESLEQVCFSLGIEMHYSPRKEPWFKGKIERFVKTLNKGIAHGIPGTCFSNIFEKGDYDPAKHAVVTFSTLKKICRLWVADIYHQKVHRALGISPVQMWNSSIKPEDIPLPDDPTQLDVIMGRADRRVLSHKGIELDGLFYNSSDLHELRCKEGSRLEVQIRVDESDIGHIYVLSPKTSQAFKVPALRGDYARGVSQWQHRVFRNQARHSGAESGPDDWLQAKETIARLIEDDFNLKRHRSRKRVGRYLGDCQATVNRPAPEDELTMVSQIHADPHTECLPALPASTATQIDFPDPEAVRDLPVTIEVRTVRA